VKFVKYFFIFAFSCIFLGAVAIFGMYKYVEADLPDVSTIRDVRLQTPMLVYSADGKLMAQFGEKRRIPIEHGQLPQKLIQAFIATEDSRFEHHHGIDPVGIARALVTYVKSGGSRKEGASTITQQLARNYFLSSERTLMRKIREAFLALKIEREFSKQEILELYVNKIELGHRAYGVGAAAYVYFGKEVGQLNLSEMAIIAGLPKAPSKYNPLSRPKEAKIRRDTVLYRMLSEGYITQAEYDATIKEPIVAKYHEPEIDFAAPYLSEMVRQEMLRQFGEDAYHDGYKVYTTVTEKLQVGATEALRKNILGYDERHGYRGPAEVLWQPGETAWTPEQITQKLKEFTIHGPLRAAVVVETVGDKATAMLADGSTIDIMFEQAKWGHPKFVTRTRKLAAKTSNIDEIMKVGQLIWARPVESGWRLAQLPQVNSALVSINSNDGAIMALVGGFDFNLSKFNRVTQSIRQAGSSIKPFIYAAAFDKGMSMATILNDLPITRWNVNNGGNWRPKNSPNIYEGPLRLRVGLGKSKNVMMVRTMRAIGVDYAADYLERFGFVSRSIERAESLALGAATVTPLQLARGYAVFANGGYLVDPYFISRIENGKGEVIFEAKPKIACTDDCDIPVVFGETEKSKLLLGQNIEDITSQTTEGMVDVPDDDEEEEPQTVDDTDTVPQPQIEVAVPDEMALPKIDPNQKVSGSDDAANAEQDKYAPHVISKQVAFLIGDGLKTNIAGEAGGNWLPTGWRARSLKRNDIGGKTGTTNRTKDAWFAGYGPGVVTTVWVGFDDHRKGLGYGEAGANTAQPAWIDYMRIALEGVPVEKAKVPEGITRVSIDMKTGQLSKGGAGSKAEYFIKGTEPTSRAIQEVGTTLVDQSTGQTQELF
jgi:penicillin-binding protein 1A